MSTYDHIAWCLVEDGETDADSICDSFEPSEVIYYSEYDDILSKYESDHGADAEDICSGMEYAAADWLEAKGAYVQALNYCAQMAEIRKDAEEMAEELAEIESVAEDLGFCGDIQFSHDCPHGWAAHNRETPKGICIWDAEPGHYNPELLEGELMAVSGKLSCGVWATATWEPEAE